MDHVKTPQINGPVMKVKPRRSRQLQNKAQGLLRTGKLDEALAVAVEACRQDPADADGWFVQAAVYAQRQDFRRVAECCQAVISHQPGNTVAHFNFGLACQSLGDQAGAAEAYRKAIALQPGYAAAQTNLSAVLIDLGETQAALACAEAALTAAPDQPAAHIAKGRALMSSGHVQAALDNLLETQRRFGNLPDIALNIAQCHKTLGDTGQAHELLHRLSQSAPGYAPAWLELGHMARLQEHYIEAAQYYERAVRIQPSTEARFNLAHCLYAADRIEPARRLYHELLEQHPDDPIIHNNLGRLYESMGQPDPAERHLRRAVELQPGRAIPHCNLGRILFGRGQYAAAHVEYALAIAADPDYFEGHFGHGQALCELGEHQAAIASFKTAIQLKPDLADAKYYIASLGGEASEADKQEYVAGLFDKYADKFDNELVNTLKYKTPQYIFDAVTTTLPKETTTYAILDLGCGTGLCAPLFRPLANRLVGVDLSSKMIDKAHERGLYDELAVADVTAFMQGSPCAYDLILAADVFVYLGDLDATFNAAHAALRPAGYFVFSTETSADGGFKIRGSGRHAHSKEYIRSLARSTGFNLIHDADCDLRLEFGKPVAGNIYVLHRNV